MQTLFAEDFLQFLRHERGQSEHTQKSYASSLKRFVDWAQAQTITDWKSVRLSHLMAFLTHERERPLANSEEKSPRKLSSESVFLEISALRAFYRFAESEKSSPSTSPKNLSLPRRLETPARKAANAAEITQLAQAGRASKSRNGVVKPPPDSATTRFSNSLTPPDCASRNCAPCASSNCTSRPGSSTSSAKATKSASCPACKKAVAAHQPLSRSRAAVNSSRRVLLRGKIYFLTRGGYTPFAARHHVAPHQRAREKRWRHLAQHHPAHAAPQFCDPPARTRGGSSRHSGTPRPRQHQHHGKFHTHVAYGNPPPRCPPQISSARMKSQAKS